MSAKTDIRPRNLVIAYYQTHFQAPFRLLVVPER